MAKFKIFGVKIYDDGKLVFEWGDCRDSEVAEDKKPAIDLKPCPFCGGEAEIDTHFSSVYERIYGEARCKKCGVKVRGDKTFDTYDATYNGYDTKEWIANAHAEALASTVKKWNRENDNG